MFKIFLALHIIAGTVGLVIGPISMFSKKAVGLHTKVGTAYFYTMAVVCVSASVLAVLHWAQNWWFLPVAAFSFSFAGKGFRAVKVRGPGWIKKHISGMLGSYIAMTTALLVVNTSNIPGAEEVPEFVFWLLPTVIGVPFIVRIVKRYDREPMPFS